jgi:hypothetical protein
MGSDREGSAEAQRDEVLLSWLLRCHHNSFLAVREPPRASDLPRWLRGAGVASFSLEYEPGCLAGEEIP